MRILIIADSLFASRERSLLARLEIGLADEGERIIQAIPRQVFATLEPGVFARSIPYAPRTFVLTRRFAVRRLAHAVRSVLHDEEGAIDVVHVFGGSAWRLAADIARELNAALAVEVWRFGLCERAAREWDFSAPGAPSLCAPDPLIEAELRRIAPRAAVAATPWGVLPADARAEPETGRAVSVMMVGTGRDAQAFAAALAGTVAAARNNPDLMIFCDADAARRADLWRVARKLNVLDRLSLIEDLEARRDLVLEGDILLHPEAAGEQRSLILEAMAHAVPVVAARDPRVSMLQDTTARLVDRTQPAQWEAAVRALLADPASARTLALAARALVREQRRASVHVRAVLQVYSQLASARAGHAKV